ncbi:TPA: hypothetical protein ACNV29_001634 [Klebsiella oxytoca]
MTSKLTRERLEELAAGQSGFNLRIATHEESKELARLALAALDSEPVAEVCEDYAIRYISSGPAPKEGLHPGDKLYRHAQQLLVPDALEKAQQENTDGVAGMAESYETTISMLRSRIAELESRTVTAAAADVLAERQRQVTAEGWTAERDDGYQNSELADAAACYAIHAHNQGFSTPAHWPWSQDWWKQTSPRRDLVKAGALILAEIERLDRAAGIKVEAE